jgi:RNA polymerase sigma-70 factor (ECF subfamily)
MIDSIEEVEGLLLSSPSFGGKASPPLPMRDVATVGANIEVDGVDSSRAKSDPPPALPMDFAEVYRTFFDHVCRWTRALGGPEAERDDLVQDVFLIVHRRLPDFDGKNVAGWLYQITRHRVRDFRRLQWFRLLLSSSPADESLTSATQGPETELASKQQEALLSGLLSKLPQAQRAAFVLFEIDGYSGEEIARLEGIPINTVWARIHKARTKLSAHIVRLRKHGKA